MSKETYGEEISLIMETYIYEKRGARFVALELGGYGAVMCQHVKRDLWRRNEPYNGNLYIRKEGRAF